MDTNWSIEFSDLEKKTLITSEESGYKLYRVVHRLTGKTYALKELIYGYPLDPQINHDVQILKKLDHPNLVKCYEMFHIGVRIYLLLEHMDRGSIAGGGYAVKGESALANIARQVLSCLSYLHRNKIPHEDIKPSNFFVNSMGQIKVLYLGKILTKAPVVIHDQHWWDIYDEFSWDVCNKFLWDVWSVGLSILRLYNGSNWVLRDYWGRPPSKELWAFLVCCMHTDSSKKWTIEELMDHPFFTGVNDTLSDEEAHQATPKTKKAKCVEDKDIICSTCEESFYAIQEGSEDPIQRVGCANSGLHSTPDYLGLRKDKLVQLWIAEGCIEEEVLKRMEDVGNLFFDILVHHELIIPSRFDFNYPKHKYRVNTSKYSTWFLKQDNYWRVDEDYLDERRGKHLTWHCKRIDRISFGALKNLKELRTLRVLEDHGVVGTELPKDSFLGLKLLRSLDLSGTLISELPSSIGEIESLRLLDISRTLIDLLPDSTDRLHLLQTLKARDCPEFHGLPYETKKLVNLRHLDLDMYKLSYMPKGMGNLTKLQTLNKFFVGKDDGLHIGELKNMNDIIGSFCISRVENVANAEEAKEAALADKQYIAKLELIWYNVGNDHLEDATEILECLQPHFHLRELTMIRFKGSKLPSWISNPLFTNLSKITLHSCVNIDLLPSLGELPALKILQINEINNVMEINTIFCRRNGTRGLNAFPRLEKLKLLLLRNLEKWTGVEDGDFPCLTHIVISHCPKLSVLPSTACFCALQYLELINFEELICLPEGLLPGSLKTLRIDECPELSKGFVRDGGQDRFRIAQIENIWVDLCKLSLD